MILLRIPQVLKRRHFGDELLLEMLKGWSDF